MMVTLGGYLFTLIARRPLGLQGTRGGPGAAPVWAARAGATGHEVAPELPRAGQWELEPQDTKRPRSCPRPGSGGWSRRTRGGPGAAPGYNLRGSTWIHALLLALT
jgi:hypothetical protein